MMIVRFEVVVAVMVTNMFRSINIFRIIYVLRVMNIVTLECTYCCRYIIVMTIFKIINSGRVTDDATVVDKSNHCDSQISSGDNDN